MMKPSVVGLVHSVDRACSHYVSFLEIQEPRLEIIQNLGSGVKVRRPEGYLSIETYCLSKECIKMFNKYRAFKRDQLMWPEQLIFYRDGVSEGEIQRVVESEISQIRGEFARC